MSSLPNLKEIEWAISELEQEESSKAGYILLAALYTCRDHMLDAEIERPSVSQYSMTPMPEQPLGLYGDSEFLRAVANTEPSTAWAVMDELMDTLRIVNQRAYDSVMRKLAR